MEDTKSKQLFSITIGTPHLDFYVLIRSQHILSSYNETKQESPKVAVYRYARVKRGHKILHIDDHRTNGIMGSAFCYNRHWQFINMNDCVVLINPTILPCLCYYSRKTRTKPIKNGPAALVLSRKDFLRCCSEVRSKNTSTKVGSMKEVSEDEGTSQAFEPSWERGTQDQSGERPLPR